MRFEETFFIFVIVRIQLFILLIFLLLIGSKSLAQSAGSRGYSESKQLNDNLEEAILNENEELQAQSYYELGLWYFNQADYTKAEVNFQKSLNLYTSLKKKSKISQVSRKLAQTQEQLSKIPQALDNYNNASLNSVEPNTRDLNRSDYSRLGNPTVANQTAQINQNINRNTQSQNKEELITNYQQMAVLNQKQNQLKEAKENLNQAITIAKEVAPEKVVALKNEKTKLLTQENKWEEALQEQKQLLKEEVVANNTELASEQWGELARLYASQNKLGEAVETFQKAYDLAVQNSHTLQAQNSLNALDSVLSLQNRTADRLSLYQKFIKDLPQMIEKDSDLVNQKVLHETEQKIQLLEQEQVLNQQLFKQKNGLNIVLFITSLILLSFLIYAYFSRRKLQLQNKRIALQSMGKDMNPHFIFNSLNSINQYIAQNDERKANKYLSQFSQLMRTALDHSNQDFVSLEEEVQWLDKYLSLENQRFTEVFDYELEVDESLLNQAYEIPVMLVQPFIENAIWHGLRYAEGKGYLQVRFQPKNEGIEITIEDNGIGIEESKNRKTEFQKQHKGIGISNTQQRIKYLNDLYKKNIDVQIEALNPGTKVRLWLPK